MLTLFFAVVADITMDPPEMRSQPALSKVAARKTRKVLSTTRTKGSQFLTRLPTDLLRIRSWETKLALGSASSMDEARSFGDDIVREIYIYSTCLLRRM